MPFLYSGKFFFNFAMINVETIAPTAIANKYFTGCPIVAITNIPPCGAISVQLNHIESAPVTADPTTNAGIVLNGSAEANGIAPSDINDKPII